MSIVNMNEIKKSGELAFLNKCISFISAIVAAILLTSSPAHAIKKCKDANGKWHYGDVAVRACDNSKITTLSKKGFVKAEKDKPKSEEQLEAERVGLVQLEEERKIKEEAEKEKSRILTVYESEADIDRQRESRLISIDNNIAVHNSYINSLKQHIDFDEKKIQNTKNNAIKSDIEAKINESKESIIESTKDINALNAKREEVIKQFEKEKAIYKELTALDEAS